MSISEGNAVNNLPRRVPPSRRHTRYRLLQVALALSLLSGVAHAADGGGVAIGGACKSDGECALGSICTDNICTALPKRKRIIPFYWHQGGDVGYRHITPIFYYSTWDREGSTKVQFPFFAETRNYKNESRTTIVPPLALWYTKFERKQGYAFGWMPLVYWKKRGPEKWLVLPLLLSGGMRNEKEDITEAVVGLVGYYRRHRDDTWRIVAPLFFDHETAKTRTTVAPLTYFRRTETKRVGVIFPLVWHFQDKLKGTQNLVVPPLFEWESARFGRRERLISPLAAWSKDEDEGVRQLLLMAPIVFHRRDRIRDVDVIPPLFVRWKVHDDQSTGLIAGPFFHQSDPEGSTTSLLPIYWRFADRKTGAETHVLFPIFGFHKHPGAAGGFLGPIYGWRSKNGLGGWGAGIAPLLFMGRSGTRTHAVVPGVLFHQSDAKDGTQTTAVGPAFYRKTTDGWHAGAFPALFFGNSGGTRYATVPGLFLHRQNKEGTTEVVGPAYGYKGSRGWAFGLAPLLFFGKLDGRSHQVVFPIFIRTDDPKRQLSRTLAGPYFHERHGTQSIDWLFPLFYMKRNPQLGYFISPIAGWKREPHKESLVVGPFGYQRDDKRHSKTGFMFPLGLVHRSPGYNLIMQFPFFWRIQEGQTTNTIVFPFYFRSRSPGKAIDVLFPLVLRSVTDAATTTVVGPAWFRARKDGGKQAGVFPLFAYGSVVKNGQTSRWLGFPGVFVAKNDIAGNTDAVAGPFFYSSRPSGFTSGLIPVAFAWRRGTATKVVTPIFYRQSDSAADSSLNVLGPLYWGHNGTTKKFGLFPLWFEKVRRDGTSETTLFPLFHLHKKLLGSLLITPLFGWSTYPSGYRAYAGPLYLRRDTAVNTTAIWPLAYFTRDKNNGTSTRMIIPLFFDGRTENGREIQAYTPLIWRYHSVERSVIIGLPLFFDVHSFKESRTTGLLPLFIRNKSEVYKSTSWVFPPLLTWARTRRGADPGTDVVILPLIYRFGGQTNNTTVVLPLFWDFKRGDSRTTVMFPIGAWWKRPDGRHHLILNMYYRRGTGHKEGTWWCDVFPLVNFGKPRKGDVEWNILEGLVGYGRQGRNRYLRIFWLFDIPLSPLPASTLTWWSSTPTSARTEF